MPITAGSISVARRINTGDYSHKEAKAEVHYTIEGDEGAAVLSGIAGRLALLNVAEVLATTVKLNETPEITVGAPESVKSDQVEQADAGFPPFAGVKRHRRTKAEMEAARAAETPPADPMMPSEPAQNPVASTPQSDAAPVQTDEWAQPLSEISDKELNNACNETMQRIKNKLLIQGAIAQYTDGAVSTIPQAERAKFLAELKAL